MANFSALKTAIQNAIKQNGNEEITGDVLQQILLSIVSSMGDGAINTIEQNLSNEATTRQGADTQLQNAINAIKANIDNGYVYAGIATPSTVPVSGKVFYISTTAGTYTNFGGQVLTQGINILRFNGSAWSSQQLIGIDDVPTAGSNKLVKSGGVQNEFALGAVYDVSAKNPTGGPNNDGKWESLSALLSDANLNTLIPTAYRKGGMSIKFVHTNDNNYKQYLLTSNSFTTDTTKWAVYSNGVYIYNPEFIAVWTDRDKKILIAVENDGNVLFGAGVPRQIIEYVNEKIAELSLDEYEDIVSFIGSLIDKQPIFSNKKVSIIGDSISTFTGYIPDGYSSWYPHEDGRSSDVTSVNDTWWKKLLDATHSTLEVNASWSGSRVTTMNGIPSFDERVNVIGNPEVIIIALGSNDSANNVEIGEIDFGASSYDLTKFAPAYIKGMQDTMKTYPNARIVCLTFDMGVDYQNTIKTIANHYGVDYIYVGDVSDVHPNKAEMQAVYEKIYDTWSLAGILSLKVDKEEGKSLIPTQYIQEIDNPEFIAVWTTPEGKILLGIQTDGDAMFGCGVPSAILKYIDGYINTENNSIRKYLDETFGFYIEDVEERMEIKTDKNKKIIKYRDKDGRLHEDVGITTNSLQLTPEGMTEFQQAMKEAGIQLGGGGDWSDRDNIELPEPKHYSLLNIVASKLPVDDGEVIEGYIEYYDGLGNYFKMACSLEAQGQTSRWFARTGGKGNYTLDLPKDVKFGNWVPQDSFHLKGCAKDVVRGILPTSYKWAYMMQEFLGSKPNRVLIDESEITTLHATGNRMNDWPCDARCLPDGFPVEVYINGEYWGLYSWQLKKHRKNYSMDKKDYTSFFIDADSIMTDNGQNGIWNDGPDALIPDKDKTWWTGFDIKGPKDLYCMDGSKFDGDNPKELIDSTSQYYDSSNKAHKGSQTTKTLIRSFQTKYLEVKTMIDNNSIEQAKVKFNENFDYLSCMMVYIYNCTMNNGDSIKKNTLWGMYKSGKIFAALWDLDAMYGEGWIGNIADKPSDYLWEHSYATAQWPLKLLWDLYEDEIKATYAALRKAKIINLDTWHDIVFNQWVNRIGEEAYNRDIKKWPETPSYRENYTNTDYWVEAGVTTIGAGAVLWSDTENYSVGDYVALKCHAQSSWCIRYRAVQASGSENPQCPVTQFYNGFPQVGGFYDSPKRWEKWMDAQIVKCDVINGYFDEVVADFTAYNSTNPDYIINCVDMSIVDDLSAAHSFIEGHITRHEIEVENQTVSVYTMYKGKETEEDTSRTYTTVMEAVEAASQQAVDVPSDNLFYIQARTRDKVFKSK